ncbi:MAG: PIN domain-containing protein [Actinobacteria bacterium]|nr:PIN domain-containing protein [Actinomycetota bacterium]
MIVLDANVIIAFLDDRDVHHGLCVDLLESNSFDGFACPVLTLAEALVHPTAAGVQDAALAAVTRIGVRILPLAPTDAAEIARVRSAYGIRMPDAVVLHAAIGHSASVMTLDEGLAAAAARAGVARAVVEQ